ncbi:uncharacterized protein SPSK_03580 [Sporothrix schenckii 1099-18]|uniref:Uncharacterized protein n=1 Tax=Sporothrix schenckii 1099-18 TaxID=1397361 RepID=A0A0F2LYN1_SPOSC|nr:uncharacterized protein SPSK_03580 [Sporothrix schenckii 1099-18]KJR82568.1 hypothetical protein SPSK_03580 [Sporothrix schenckii 1099-18]
MATVVGSCSLATPDTTQPQVAHKWHSAERDKHASRAFSCFAKAVFHLARVTSAGRFSGSRPGRRDKRQRGCVATQACPMRCYLSTTVRQRHKYDGRYPARDESASAQIKARKARKTNKSRDTDGPRPQRQRHPSRGLRIFGWQANTYLTSVAIAKLPPGAICAARTWGFGVVQKTRREVGNGVDWQMPTRREAERKGGAKRVGEREAWRVEMQNEDEKGVFGEVARNDDKRMRQSGSVCRAAAVVL